MEVERSIWVAVLRGLRQAPTRHGTDAYNEPLVDEASERHLGYQNSFMLFRCDMVGGRRPELVNCISLRQGCLCSFVEGMLSAPPSWSMEPYNRQLSFLL
jgi:hypothetical protein